MLQARSWLPRTEGSVRLALARADGGTALADLHQSGAARVRFPRPAERGGLEAVLLNTAGGLTGGDRIDIGVTLGADCSAALTSAAAEKIYRALDDAVAEVRMRLELGAGACACWLPQPTILFDRARLDRRADIAMAGSASLLAAEFLIFGRAAMGEDVRRGLVRDAWRVRRSGRLVFADTLLAHGPVADILDRAATLDGARAIALILYAAPNAAARIEEARALLRDASSVAGVTTWNGLLVVRAASRDGRTLQKDLEPLIARLAARPLPRVWQC